MKLFKKKKGWINDIWNVNLQQVVRQNNEHS
jgi:hypothetical protein